jgi:hypothetical protein
MAPRQVLSDDWALLLLLLPRQRDDHVHGDSPTWPLEQATRRSRSRLHRRGQHVNAKRDPHAPAHGGAFSWPGLQLLGRGGEVSEPSTAELCLPSVHSRSRVGARVDW